MVKKRERKDRKRIFGWAPALICSFLTPVCIYVFWLFSRSHTHHQQTGGYVHLVGVKEKKRLKS